MSLSVFNPSLYSLSPLHPVLCHSFKAKAFVGILPSRGLNDGPFAGSIEVSE